MTDLLTQLQSATAADGYLYKSVVREFRVQDRIDEETYRSAMHWISVGAFLSAIVSLVPEGWFIAGMGEEVKPIVYAGDLHEPRGTFNAALQRREGGMWTQESATSLPLALCQAIIKAHQSKAEQAA